MNSFAKVSKNLVATYKSQNNFIHQNNYVGRSSWLLKCFCFLQHCLSYLSFLHNYVDDPKLFLDLYLSKYLDTSAKLFFSYV